MTHFRAILLAAALAASCASPAGGATPTAQFHASRVVEYAPGDGNVAFPNPDLALGGPMAYPGGSLHVVTLGVQGNLVLGFVPGEAIADAAGDDLIVFENAFWIYGWAFVELVRVGVSTNGMDYAFWPTGCGRTTPVGPYEYVDPSDYAGFAGVNQTFANVGPPPDGNALDPFDPATGGGDAFDLADLADDPLVAAGTVDLDRIYYVKLIDVLGDGTESDSVGNPIYDPAGLMDEEGGFQPVSADVDALSVIHGLGAPIPGDANRDDIVNLTDLSILAFHWDTAAGATWDDGDFDADGAVALADLSALAFHWLETGAARAVVPEPTALTVLAVGAAAATRRRRPIGKR